MIMTSAQFFSDMRALPNAALEPPNPVSFYWSGTHLRSRSVSPRVLTGTVDVPPPPSRLVADWQRDISGHLGLEAGDVESLSLARARVRWPDYRHCVQAMSGWTGTLGLPDILEQSEVALMACRGAHYHHDGVQYGANAFCNLFLSEEQELDLHFPAIDLRIPLQRGTAVLFDTCQPHAVIRRGRNGFDPNDFPAGSACDLVFLTWELHIEDPRVTRLLGVHFDIAADAARQPTAAGVRVQNAMAKVCPSTGLWQARD
jgi:hypothetical protein